MALTFGDVGTLLGLLGLVTVGISLLANYLGITGLFDVLTNMWNGFTNIMGRILSFSPKPIQILFFLVAGSTVLGLMFSWFLAGDIVCSSCNTYQAPSYVSAVYAKFQSPDNGLLCNADGSTSSDPSFVGGVTSLTTGLETYSQFGTFLTTGEKTSPAVQTPLDAQMVLAFPISTQVKEGQTGYVFSICKAGSAYTLPKTGAAVAQGQCYLADGEGSTLGIAHDCYSFFDQNLGNVKYNFLTAKDDAGNEHTGIEVSYLDGSVGASANDVVGMNNCPQSGYGTGTVIAYNLTPGRYSSRSQLVTIVPQSGYSLAKYVNITIVNSQVQTEGSSKRATVVNAKGSGFNLMSRDNSQFVSYACQGNNEVAVLLYGIDVFNFKTLVAIVVLYGVLYLLAFLKIIRA